MPKGAVGRSRWTAWGTRGYSPEDHYDEPLEKPLDRQMAHAGKNVTVGSDRLARNIVLDSFLHQLSDELKYKLLLTPF